MSYIGIVTKQNARSGLTLRAKITSPSGAKSKYVDFPCVVKSSGLTDLQCVIRDLALVSNAIIVAGTINMKDNLNSVMVKKGPNDTIIKYTSSIPDSFSNDGIILQRPNFGGTAKTGSLTIQVSKGAEAVERTIDISIAQYGKEEIAAAAMEKISWSAIRGQNAVESSNGESGLLNVAYDLVLPTTVIVNGSEDPIAVNWTVTDTLSSILGAARLTSAGKLTRKSYNDVMGLINGGQLGSTYYVYTALNGLPTIRIKGIKVTAKVSVGTESPITLNKDFVLNTMSMPISNTEVKTYFQENATISGSTPTNQVITYNTKVNANITVEKTKVTLFTADDILNKSYSDLFGTNKGIVITNVNWELSQTTGAAYEGDTSFIVGGGINFGGVNPTVEFSNLPAEPTQIGIKCTARVVSYDGEAADASMIFKFTVKNA